MKFFIVLSFLIAATWAGVDYTPRLPLVPIVPRGQSDGRITNGKLAAPGQFPYQVGLLLALGNSSAWCGGTLISDRWVLTAAHCTDGADGVTVFLGAIDIKNPQEEGQQRVYTTKSNITVHPNWDPSNFSNDISLIQLPEAVAFNSRIQPATLPKMGGPYSNYEGDYVWASGWGKESDAATTVSQYLRYIEVPVIRRSICYIYFFGSITENMICINGRNGKSACNGDSGGPMVYKDGETNYVIGATSFGIALGCEKGWPGVYTRVTSYLDWIEDVSGVANK